MISGTLEYLMSSLPCLSFQNSEEERSRVTNLLKKYAGDSGTPTDLIAILDEEAAKYLGSGQAKHFRKITLQTVHESEFRQSRNSVLAGFARYRYQLKKAVASLRQARREGQEKAVKEKEQILTPGTPLEEEVQLLRRQWEALEEISIGHYADFAALLAYKLKLLLLLRWWEFTPDQGLEVFSQITKPGYHGG